MHVSVLTVRLVSSFSFSCFSPLLRLATCSLKPRLSTSAECSRWLKSRKCCWRAETRVWWEEPHESEGAELQMFLFSNPGQYLGLQPWRRWPDLLRLFSTRGGAGARLVQDVMEEAGQGGASC